MNSDSNKRWRQRTRKHTAGIAVGILLPVVALGVAACGSTSANSSTTASASTSTAARTVGSDGAAKSGARTTNAAGGSVGKVTTVSSSGFTLSTPTGQKVTVKETSSTVYENGTTTATASAVTAGQTTLVVGQVDSTTITASQVVVGPAINLSKASSAVLSYEKGTKGASQSVGQIPKDYTEGSGAIVSGAAATKATEAALTSYAGGVVDRVVLLSNGEYEVHYIGANWPHHIFVNSDFKVVGAD
jgi:membrane-bound inhibitor of C-type lysozyme